MCERRGVRELALSKIPGLDFQAIVGGGGNVENCSFVWTIIFIVQSSSRGGGGPLALIIFSMN